MTPGWIRRYRWLFAEFARQHGRPGAVEEVVAWALGQGLLQGGDHLENMRQALASGERWGAVRKHIPRCRRGGRG
jgi:hypothetical protein